MVFIDFNLQTQDTLNSTTINAYWHEIVAGYPAVVVEVFLYGFHLNLFLVALYVFSCRKTAGKRILLSFTWVMATLATTQIVLDLAASAISLRLGFIGPGTVSDSISSLLDSKLGETYNSLILAQNLIFPINNLVTDALFLYRCYMIWGSRWKVVFFPGLLIVGTFVTGCVAGTLLPATQKAQQAPYILAAFTNFILVLLTAGRIWWIRRHAKLPLYSNPGVIYCIFTILLIATYPLGVPFTIIQAMTRQLINIVPTLIIVRVGLGQHTEPERVRAKYENWAAPPSVRVDSTLDLDSFP
ncbi:hypothetical protein MSAN_02351400 [Mycena sanguinolenta]|uniref:Uncharacterized protein n=1 Tax=Mycena sanguinolenta TaxID=230812 RepID=A0A8H6X6U9_9AGAR|nr:hypothetical protein MSAN_02351400 [Mycena sanguinolenta]